MMQRRRIVQALTGLGTFSSTALMLSGCNMSSKTNIKSFGKIFQYLNDPALRTKETNDSLLTIKGALFSGVNFQYLTWRNIHFVDCDFAGGYEIKLEAMANCVFEGCKIVGIHDFGVMESVRFYKCLSGSKSIWGGQVDSKNVMFEECQFVGSSSDQNHQGGIGTYGEAIFVSCKIKWFAVMGHTKLVLRGCECEDIRTSLNNEEKGSAVLIENCKLRGTFDMVPASLQSLTIRDTVIDNLDLSGASVKGDVVMERVKGGYMQVGVRQGANTFTLKDSQIYGNGKEVCGIYAGAFKTVLIENTVFGGDIGQYVVIGGGFQPDNKNPQPVLTQSLVFRNCKIPSLRSGRLNAAQVLLQGNEIDALDMDESRIGQLEFSNTTISRTLDLSKTHVGSFKQTGGTNLRKLGGGLKLDGSNVKIN